MSERITLKETAEVKARLHTGAFLPPHKITNQALIDHGVTKPSGEAPTAEGIYETTGIWERYWIRELGSQLPFRKVVVPQMATRAAMQAIDGAHWRSIDELFATTSIPYQESLAHNVASRLRLPVGKVNGDIYTACAGSVRALHHIKKNERDFIGKKVLVVASEYLSTLMNNIHITLFADGAAALCFVYGKDLKVLGSAEVYDPSKKDLIQVTISRENLPSRAEEQPLYFHPIEAPEGSPLNGEKGLDLGCGDLKGPRVFAWAVRKIPNLIVDACDDANVKLEDIDYVFLHQANQRMTDPIKEKLQELGMTAKVPSNIECRGNSSAVSVPMLVHEQKLDGQIMQGQRGVWAAFGAGMNAVAVVVEH